MQQSRLQTFCLLQTVLDVKDQIPHHHCNCIHCINNTKPLPPIIAPRIVSQKEKQIINSKAYQLVLKETTKGFSGKCQIPDVFFLGDASLIYQSRSNGKPKLKERQTNIEIKKHFEEQRKRVGISASFVANSIFTITESQGQNSFLSTIKTQQKQIALLAYHDGTQQILTDTLLSKMLDKRKNDSIWEGVSHLILIPPEIKQPIQQFSFHYIRSNDTLPDLAPIMDKIAENIDNLEQNVIAGTKSKTIDEKLKFLQLSVEQQMEMSVNPESKMQSSYSRKTKSMMIPKKKTSFVYMSEKALSQTMKIACLQIVAYIEVSSFNRILQADFDFFSDGSKLFVHNIRNFIYEQLEDKELTIVHDRYKPLEQISLKDIAVQKQQYDKIEAKQLWNICTAVVKECLQFRKVELKLANYNKPSDQTLLGIFMKIFPDFEADKIFSSINWKNQLDSFIAQVRTKVNKIIREDQGIRILRRFGIEFKRTFH